MNWDQVEGNWKVFRGKIREQWGKLTEDDLDVISGKRVQLIGHLQRAYGIGKEDAENQVGEFERTLHTAETTTKG